ncbi:hypothetical protein TSST111916_21295 [Tsukamurella strandjordii]
MKPGPPSDWGARITSSDGLAVRQPAAIACAACAAVRVPPNESGATSTRAETPANCDDMRRV